MAGGGNGSDNEKKAVHRVKWWRGKGTKAKRAKFGHGIEHKRDRKGSGHYLITKPDESRLRCGREKDKQMKTKRVVTEMRKGER